MLFVEGYTDVIQMHQAGIQMLWSSSGTALTPDQVRLIRRLTDKITLLDDGDIAGLRAAIRGVDDFWRLECMFCYAHFHRVKIQIVL